MKESILRKLDLDDPMAVTLGMLEAYPMQYLALIGLDGKPKVKAFEFKCAHEGKLWFDTVRGQETWKELSQNPYIELTVADSQTTEWIRISGKVRFVNDQSIREMVFAASPILTKYYGGPSNQDVIPFTLDEVKVEVSSLDVSIGRHCYSL